MERTCRQGDPTACVIRFQIPGLPRTPIIDDEGRP
jgi:hypothetical protein